MGTSASEIRSWLNHGKAKGATHVIVVCDTFSWDDYPVFVMPGEDVYKIKQDNDGPNMRKVMEVYRLDLNLELQLTETRAFHY